MSETGSIRRGWPELKALVTEASQALAQLDAGRLEELAASCQALNGQFRMTLADGPAGADGEARAARSEMATFARVLEATGSNLQVMRRLQSLREGTSEYGPGGRPALGLEGRAHGND